MNLMADKIKVLIVDDHAVVRMGLRTLLSFAPDMEISAEAASGAEAVERFKASTPAVTLLDIRMEGLGGIETLVALRGLKPDAKIIMLTTSDTEEDIYRAIKAGASGYLIKDAPPEKIIEGIRAVMAGKSCFPPNVMSAFAVRESQRDLSPKQLEILRLMAKGLSNREIAELSGNSEETIKWHLKNLYVRLNVSGRAEAIKAAMDRGIL